MIDNKGGITVTQNPLYQGDLAQPKGDADQNKAGKAGKSTKVELVDVSDLQGKDRKELKLGERGRLQANAYQRTFGKELGLALFKTKITITNALSRAGDNFRLLGAHIKDHFNKPDAVLDSAYAKFVKTPTKSEVVQHFRQSNDETKSMVSQEQYDISEARVQSFERNLDYVPMHELREGFAKTMKALRPATEEITHQMKADLLENNLEELKRQLKNGA